MGTRSQHPAISRTDLYESLFEPIARHRDATQASRMVESLLRKGRSSDQLVALIDDCERVVYYSPHGRMIKGYTFDENGVHEADVDTLWRLLSDAASWVDAHQDECDWVHPHFRWVLGLDEDEWAYRPG